MSEQKWALVGTGLSIILGVVTGLTIPGPARWVVLGVAGVFLFLCGYYFASGRALAEPTEPDPRVRQLDELGIVAVYQKSTAEPDVVGPRVRRAQQVRVLAVSGDLLFRNVRAAIVDALARGCEMTVLLATPRSDAVREIDEMEIADGRPPGAGFTDASIGQAEVVLRDCVAAAAGQLPRGQQDRLGKVVLGHFNAQYRASMILCDRDWAWYTPHLPPLRTEHRPSFVAEGESSRLRQLCEEHFKAVQEASHPRQLRLGMQEPTESA